MESSDQKIWKLWKINGNVEKIKVKKVTSTFFVTKEINHKNLPSTHQHISNWILIMFSSSRIKSCLKSFPILVSSSSTQLLVNLRQKKLSHLLVSHKKSVVNSKLYIVIYLLLSVISISNCAANALLDSSSSAADGYNLEELGAIFHKVAYQTSTTTTKRSIIDNVYVPSITTVPTPSLTTFRYVVVVLLWVLSLYFILCLLFWLRYQKKKKYNETVEIIHSFFLYFTSMDYVCLLSFTKKEKGIWIRRIKEKKGE